uniref:Uncharacterized protein n=1 Tax=Zea mays TaxID=4577 RepID=B6U517_MAIZE|nr:hypothetical protein [Zea mays]
MIGCWCDLASIPATGIDGRVGYCFRRRGPGGVAWPGFAMLLGSSPLVISAALKILVIISETPIM